MDLYSHIYMFYDCIFFAFEFDIVSKSSSREWGVLGFTE